MSTRERGRRGWLGAAAACVLGLALVVPAFAAGDWAAVGPGTVVLLRHAQAPGVGDPQGMRIGECSTQRNLDEAGRAQAQRIGAAFRERGIAVSAVWSSQWCRTRETADLAFPGRRVDQVAFNSFFGQPQDGAAQVERARALLLRWRGPGVLVVVTHQVNITGLTGVVPASGEGVVVQPQAGSLRVLGRVLP